MERTPSLSGGSDDGSYDLAARPLTPNTSTLFRPSDNCKVNDKWQAHLLTEIDFETPVPPQTVEQGLLRDEVPSPSIRNICFIGAGHVGMLIRHNNAS